MVWLSSYVTEAPGVNNSHHGLLLLRLDHFSLRHGIVIVYSSTHRCQRRRYLPCQTLERVTTSIPCLDVHPFKKDNDADLATPPTCLHYAAAPNQLVSSLSAAHRACTKNSWLLKRSKWKWKESAFDEYDGGHRPRAGGISDTLPPQHKQVTITKTCT